MNGDARVGETGASLTLDEAVDALESGSSADSTAPEMDGTDAASVVAAADHKCNEGATPSVPPPPAADDLEPVDGSSSTAFVSSVSVLDNSSAMPHADVSAHGEEQSANHVGYSTQVSGIQMEGNFLEVAPSFTSTVPDFNPQDLAAFSENGAATVINGGQAEEETSSDDKPVEEAENPEQDHLPEPPLSPTTLLSTSSTSTYGEAPPKVDVKPPRIPSANRLSISYAGGSKRLVIDAEVIQKLQVFRQDGRIEVYLNIDQDGEDGLKGILVSGNRQSLLCYVDVFFRSKACPRKQNRIFPFPLSQMH